MRTFALAKTETTHIMKLSTHIYAALFLVFAFAIGLPATAQTDVEFSEMEHSLGTLVWHNSAQATFTLTNTGTKDLVITDVEPDCGCTLVSWTQGPIAPGKSGSISARYDAAQLGHFSKSFAVYLNQDQVPVYLSISGKVVNADLKATAATFDYHFGDIDLSTDEVEFDDVHGGDEPFRTIDIVNHGTEIVTPTLMHLPTYLTASYAPEILYPGASGKILLTLQPDRLPTYGLTQANVYLSTKLGSKVERENEITVSATLLPEVDEELAASTDQPCLELDKTSVDVGQLDGRKRRDQIVISNSGTAPLEIIAVQVYNPGIGLSVGKSHVAPGGKTKLKVSVGPEAFKFKGRHAILLITNDPKQPKVIVPVNAKK